VEQAEAFLKAIPVEKGQPKPSLTHFIAKIVADCLQEHPELNHLLRRDQLHRRARTDVFITTLLKTAGKGADLSGFTLPDAPNLSLVGMARLSTEAVDRLKKGEDAEAKRIEELSAKMPVWLMRLTMAFQDFVHFDLNRS
jgi:pyruvate/2-oxoglutarate dehydrogenase complex dihydrolipoamide acyltransferase (E2) component